MDYPAPTPPYLGPPKHHSGNGNKRAGAHPIDRIVLHGAVTPCAEGWARKVAVMFRDGTVRGSAHYTVDPAETFQAAYDDVVAWHAPPNPHSLGIEFADPVTGPLKRWDDRPHRRTLRRGARLTAELALAYNVPVRMIGPKALKAGRRGICDHDDVSKAWGQSSHWDLGAFPRRRFIRLVRAEVARIKGDEPTAQREERKAESRITKARDLLEAALKVAKHPRRQRRIRKGLEVLPPH